MTFPDPEILTLKEEGEPLYFTFPDPEMVAANVPLSTKTSELPDPVI